MHCLWQCLPKRDGVWPRKKLVILYRLTTSTFFLGDYSLFSIQNLMYSWSLSQKHACLMWNVKSDRIVWKWFSSLWTREIAHFQINPVIFWCNPFPNWFFPKGVSFIVTRSCSCHLLTCLTCNELGEGLNCPSSPWEPQRQKLGRDLPQHWDKNCYVAFVDTCAKEFWQLFFKTWVVSLPEIERSLYSIKIRMFILFHILYFLKSRVLLPVRSILFIV